MNDTNMPLGKHIDAPDQYAPEVLHAIERSLSRQNAGMGEVLPFDGEDIWNCYELSWLNLQGLPRVAALSIQIPCKSPRLVESKSLKLYLNSFSQERFEQERDLCVSISRDLHALLGMAVVLDLRTIENIPRVQANLPGKCLDDLNVVIDAYSHEPELLGLEPDSEQEAANRSTKEVLYTHLFRSLCPVTAQPDFASLAISYSGRKISHEKLLAYLISYRNHAAFHESTIEQIFLDINRICTPDELTVYARFTRRGGIDINPFRSNVSTRAPRERLSRQ